MSLRVLHLNSGNLYGGVETYLATLAECRAMAPDMSPEFGVCYTGRHEAELRNSGCPVHLLGAVRFSRPWTVWRARRALKTLLQTRPIDVVVAHQPWIQALLGRTITSCRKGYIAYFHGVAGDGWPERKARGTTPSLVVAPSQYTLDTVKDWFPGTPRAMVPNPLPRRLLELKPLSAEERRERRRAMGATPEDVVILMASRVESTKGPDVVMEALAQLKDEPRWQFWYAGAPQRPQEQELFERMKQLAESAGIVNRVRFLGLWNDVPSLLQLTDVLTQGNRGAEGFGLTFLEASYNRVAVVTTEPAALGGMADATNSLIVPANDATALATALRRVIEDATLRATLGDAGRRKAETQCAPAVLLPRLAGLLGGSTTRTVHAGRLVPPSQTPL
jgi:glycosyltransferase involved in cell wall biosynthesis